ncbi:uromodulin-like [Mixophyes fleayi]|uniref:uromodulin-like n=1 Tax=Mixophyes fleayi TaxID=3061075 RepID=UPI003F4E0132
MKTFLVLLLALCTHLSSVHSANETSCSATNCSCDPNKYTVTVKPPNPTVVCSSGLMTIYISKCQLEKSQFNSSNLALIDNTGPDCVGVDNLVDGEVKVTFHDPMSTGKCGNNITINSTHVIFFNILHIYPKESKIITRSNATAELSCAYPLVFPAQLNMTLKPIISTTLLSVPGAVGAMTVTMAAYIDSTFTTPVTADTVLYVEGTVYISVWIPNLEANSFSIKVKSIYAGPGGAEAGVGENYTLTTGSDGCPDPSYGVDLITVINNGNGSEARFSMKVFQITSKDYVNIYADVTICNATCVKFCSARSDDSFTYGNVARIGVELFAGKCFSMSWTLVSLILSLLFVKLI